VNRPPLRTLGRSCWALVPLVLASCGSGTGPGGAARSADASLKAADTAVQTAMTGYAAEVDRCTAAPSPVVCLETADRTLGNQIHTYANLLAVGRGFSAPRGELAVARNAAQTLANSLEILGDAQPTQANYDQVRNTFDVVAAITGLQRAVSKVQHSLGA